MTARDIFALLPGTWELKREIPDQGHMTGTATFSPLDGGRLIYEEKGVLTLDKTGDQLAANRSYIYELSGDKIIIYYNDPARSGEILHELEFSDAHGQMVSRHCHVCIDDTYDLVFELRPDRSIRMSYQIHGPAKNYAIHTQLTPSPF